MPRFPSSIAQLQCETAPPKRSGLAEAEASSSSCGLPATRLIVHGLIVQIVAGVLL